MAQFHQKRLSSQIWLDFGPSSLTYRMRDHAGDIAFDVDYTAVPTSRRIAFDRNQTLRILGLIGCVLGVLHFTLSAIVGSLTINSIFWLLIGPIFLGAYHATWAEYTVFDTEEGPLYVMKNDIHDEIIAKLDEERKRHLLAWYRGIDFGGNAENEIHTIEWLAKRKVLSRQEADAKISELSAEADHMFTDFPMPDDVKKIH